MRDAMVALSNGTGILTVIARVAGALALALYCAAAAPAESIKIAFLGSLSGPFALQGEETLKNLQAAADLVNMRGGALEGRKFEIVAFDNKGNPQESLVVLKQAIDREIRIVISGVSNVAHALSNALEKHNQRNPDQTTLFLDYGALDPALTEAKCSFWHFRFESHADMQVGVLTDYIARLPAVKKVYLINQDYAFGQAVSRVSSELLAKKRPDIEIVANEFIPLGKVKDFAPYVAKIRASGADSVMTGNWGNDLSLLIKAGNEAGLNVNFYTLLAAFFGTPSAIGPSGVDRVKAIYAWNINAAEPGWEKLLLEYKARYRGVTNMDYLPVYRVMEMLVAAMKKAGSEHAQKVAYALEGLEYVGPSGRSWMRAEDHQMIAPIYVLGLAKSGTPGVKHDAEGNGLGWKIEALITAADTVPPVRCKMLRPGQ
jgi:branched-chain amino acid transport system substrate-binding protein